MTFLNRIWFSKDAATGDTKGKAVGVIRTDAGTRVVADDKQSIRDAMRRASDIVGMHPDRKTSISVKKDS